MRWLTQLQIRIAMLFGRRRAAARLDDELRFHLDQQIAENIAAGLSPDEARHAAMRLFGNPALLRDRTRATWTWTSIELVLRDLRFGVRTLLRTPGFAIIAILVMALGIGSNVALFTIVRGVLLKPLPFADPDHLVMAWERGVGDDATSQYNVVAGGMFAEWKKQNHTFQDLALTGSSEFNLSAAGGQLPEKLHGVNATWNLLSLLGVRPALGRGFTAAEDQRSAQATVILTWGLWQRRFGADPAILNQTIHINTFPYTVIGVLPASFVFPEDPSVQILTPIYHDKPPDRMESLGNHQFEVFGRLLPGVSPTQATADLAVIAQRLHNAHPDEGYIGRSAVVRSLLEDMTGDTRRPLDIMFAATACVLLIACLNVANLLVARAASRRREKAIRIALGGGRLRLLRETLMESLLISIGGGACGIAFAGAAIAWLVKTRPDISRAESIRIDAWVLVFTAGLIVFCALFAAAIGLVVARDNQILASLQESSRTSSAGHSRVRLRKSLLALELGLTVVLLIAAGLLLKSYQKLRTSDMGCTTENVLTMRIAVFGGKYNDRAPKVRFFSELLTRIRALPGVEAAGFVQAVPGQGYWGDGGISIVEHPPLSAGQIQSAIYRWADPGYFHALGIPILRGRSFDPGKQLDGANEIVISKSFADQYFPNEDPIGKHINSDGRILAVVGVVGDTRYTPSEVPGPTDYVPLYAGFANNGTLVIRSSHNVEQFALPVQKIIQSMDRDLAVSDVLTLNQLLGKSTVDAGFDATLLMLFASLSLLLAAVGLFGVLSYIVAQRTSEIGIRIALGAPRDQVMRNVLFDGLQPALIGLVLGLAASAGVVRLLESMLYGTKPLDPAVFAAVSATLLLVAAFACAIPAWRASRLDPMQALRTE